MTNIILPRDGIISWERKECDISSNSDVRVSQTFVVVRCSFAEPGSVTHSAQKTKSNESTLFSLSLCVNLISWLHTKPAGLIMWPEVLTECCNQSGTSSPPQTTGRHPCGSWAGCSHPHSCSRSWRGYPDVPSCSCCEYVTVWEKQSAADGTLPPNTQAYIHNGLLSLTHISIKLQESLEVVLVAQSGMGSQPL